MSRAELQAFFDAADDRAERMAGAGRKGWLAAFRDATLFKVAYGRGCGAGRRRCLTWWTSRRTRPLRNSAGSGCARCGSARRCAARRRGGGRWPRGLPWAAEALGQYLSEVRPGYGRESHPALWLTERGGRISTRSVDDRFTLYRAAAGLPAELSVHCLRHSYVSHLIEDGVDPLFVQQQVGHSWASTTATYTSIGADAKNRMLRAALSAAFGAATEAGR